MFDILGALGGGAITGLIGSITNAISAYKLKQLELQQKKLELEHEKEMVKVTAEAEKIEAEAKIKVTETVYEGRERELNAKAFIESQKQDSKQLFTEKYMEFLFNYNGKLSFITIPIAVFLAFLFGIADAIRKLTRPTVTAYLIGASTYLTYIVYKIIKMTQGSIDPNLAMQVFRIALLSILYLTATAVCWWFADRNYGKMMQKVLFKDGSK